MEIYTSKQIINAFKPDLAAAMIRDGLIAYSAGKVQLAPAQHIKFDALEADCVIKSGYLEGDKVFTVKVSSGFYQNPQQGLASNHGMLIVFSARTGVPQALLLDKGWLTAQRTAMTGRLVAEAMAPAEVEAIGILGTGQQAHMQLEALGEVQPCRKVWVWGRHEAGLNAFCEHFRDMGYDMRPTQDAQQLAAACRLIVTCTPSPHPLLQAEWIMPGTHITAVGADRKGKQELSCNLVALADVRVADSLSQSLEFGEFSHAFEAGLISQADVAELGNVLAGKLQGRQSASDITIADLTGLAIQDVQIAKSVLAMAE
ncbi:ornithine cyclodeaminase family protein [Vogesella sp. LIG4]|uniref:ornithine cyclodeaminase family protein n=1 Tax=Vogesella sp. LIG4 TaxID=1192162 RepID=UPI000B5AD683|nr:ornithine cyclodeaminase family protein [Vogesella sp. LIG4]